MINLTISSLLLSSLSHSPLFAMNMDHKIDKSSFIKHFSTIFYLRTSLYCSNSNFKYLLSSLINNENNGVDICPSNNQEITPSGPNYILHRDTANHCAGQYNTFISIASVTNNVSISECLFYSMSVTNTYISLKNSISYCQFIGNCFSTITSSSYLIDSDQTKSSNTYLYSQNSFNEITISGSSFGNGILANRLVEHGLNFQYNNFSNNKINDSLALTIERKVQIAVEVKYCDIYSNSAIGVLADTFGRGQDFNAANPSIKISYVSCVGNTILRAGSTFNTEHYFEQSYSIFYIKAQQLELTSCSFVNFTVNTADRNLKLFASFTGITSTTPQITISNNIFTSYSGFATFDDSKIQYQFSATYTDNAFSNTAFTTVPFSMNEYLHDNYIGYCPIYYTPNTPTPVFSPSQSFTASHSFTASNSFSPSNHFTPQYNFPGDIPSTTIDPLYGAVGCFGTALVSFGVGAIIWLILRNFIIYNHDNIFHIDI